MHGDISASLSISREYYRSDQSVSINNTGSFAAHALFLVLVPPSFLSLLYLSPVHLPSSSMHLNSTLMLDSSRYRIKLPHRRLLGRGYPAPSIDDRSVGLQRNEEREEKTRGTPEGEKIRTAYYNKIAICKAKSIVLFRFVALLADRDSFSFALISN